MSAASFNPNPKILSLLLNLGADINGKDHRGSTPLILAAQFGVSSDVIMLLLEKGANAKVKNNRGMTALDYAKNNAELNNSEAFWALNDASFE